jgi:hypothetical protein
MNPVIAQQAWFSLGIKMSLSVNGCAMAGLRLQLATMSESGFGHELLR